MLEDKSGNLWIGTDGGLNKIDAQTEKITIFKNNVNNPNSLSSNKIYSLSEDKYGNIWIATHRGLNKLNTSSEKITRIIVNPNDKKGLSFNLISHQFFSSKHRIC